MQKLFFRIMPLIAVFFILSGIAGISSFADSDKEYSISGYDVNVRINSDGSLDVTESVKFTFFGGFNNIMLLIDKREGEEVEVKNVYMLRKEGYIECDRLSAGQWDANVFSGTYSVVQENGHVKLKVYGTFSNRYGSIAVQYSVKNAIKRYRDVAEYNRTHIFKDWVGRISDININIYLPVYTETSSIRPFLHGVLVGRKTVESRRSISYNVPDTVPGEYVETRVVFPEKVVANARQTYDQPYLQTILHEESEYESSDKADLLRARENAAKEAGRRAWNERVKQRARSVAAVFSVLASAAGLYALFAIQRRIRRLKSTPMPPHFRDIEEFTPSEVRLLSSNGKTGARAFLGSLFRLVSLGYLQLGRDEAAGSKAVITFRPTHKRDYCSLNRSEQYLMGWITGNSDVSVSGVFNPRDLLRNAEGKMTAIGLKRLYDEWELRVLEDYSDKNVLGRELLKYRNLGLIMGTVLFFLGCFIPVALSIWAGYLMFPVGLSLFLYALRIRKHTDFGITRHRIWKELKKRIKSNTIALDSLPPYMTEAETLLGYFVAMGTEKYPNLVLSAMKRKPSRLSEILPEENEDLLSSLVAETLRIFGQALSSIQDAA